MTRKHYILLAKALADARPARPSPGESLIPYSVWVDCRDAIAYALAKDNPAFRIDRFTKATEA